MWSKCFKLGLLVNDLRFYLSQAKCVDDTSIVSVSDEPTDNFLQSASAELCDTPIGTV
jgi:hypothetical protein